MSSFDTASNYVLGNEGGIEANWIRDSGGYTKYGISQKWHPNEDIQNLTIERAKEIYHRDYWKFDDVADTNLACKLLDICVSLGYSAGARLIQRALSTPQDGIIDPETIKLLNAGTPANIMNELKTRVAEYYARTVLKNPSDVGFLLGWLRRAVRP